MPNISYLTSPPPLLSLSFLPSPPPPPPPPPTIAATTAAVATAPKVLFQDYTVKPFKLIFYIDLVLLKTIHSYLNIKTPFKLILFTTLYLYKNSLKYKAESLFKELKNINNAVVR